jgi:hypothetical protein
MFPGSTIRALKVKHSKCFFSYSNAFLISIFDSVRVFPDPPNNRILLLQRQDLILRSDHIVAICLGMARAEGPIGHQLKIRHPSQLAVGVRDSDEWGRIESR